MTCFPQQIHFSSSSGEISVSTPLLSLLSTKKTQQNHKKTKMSLVSPTLRRKMKAPVASSSFVLWQGEVLWTGLSDAHTDQLVRVRILVIPGAICEAEKVLPVISSTASSQVGREVQALQHRRVSLVGCRVEMAGEEVWIQGAEKLSRLVICKPCGEADHRLVFGLAVRAAIAVSPSLEGICIASIGKQSRTSNDGAAAAAAAATKTTGATPASPTGGKDVATKTAAGKNTVQNIVSPATLVKLTSNKHRLVLQLRPVVVVGFQEPPERKGKKEIDGVKTTAAESSSTTTTTTTIRPFPTSTPNDAPIWLKYKAISSSSSSSSGGKNDNNNDSMGGKKSIAETEGGATFKEDPVWLKLKRGAIVGRGMETSTTTTSAGEAAMGATGLYRILGLRRMYRSELAKTQSFFSTSLALRPIDLQADVIMAMMSAATADDEKQDINASEAHQEGGVLVEGGDDKKEGEGTAQENDSRINHHVESSIFLTGSYLTLRRLDTAVLGLQLYMKGIWVTHVIACVIHIQARVRGWIVRRRIGTKVLGGGGGGGGGSGGGRAAAVARMQSSGGGM